MTSDTINKIDRQKHEFKKLQYKEKAEVSICNIQRSLTNSLERGNS